MYEKSKQVNEWHRNEFPDDFAAIDADLIGVCERCATTLYLQEHATTDEKSTRFLRRLSADHRNKPPVFLIIHEPTDELVVRRIEEVFPKARDHTEASYFDRIYELRFEHEDDCIGGAGD
jgi:hypothetical protein